MKRAIDLSLKHTYLAHDVQKAEGTPYRSYLELDEVRHSFRSCMPYSIVFDEAVALRADHIAVVSSLWQVRRAQQERLENK